MSSDGLWKSWLNMAEYEKIRKETIDMVKKAEDEWWLSECEKLQNAGEKEKWKIISRLMNHTLVTDVWRIRSMTEVAIYIAL